MNQLKILTIFYEVSVVISARRRNEASYIHSKVTGTRVRMENGTLGKEELRGFQISTYNSVVSAFVEQNGILWM